MESVYKSRSEAINFVGVATRDEAENAAAFLQDFGVTYPQLSDPDAGLLGDLRSPGLPVTIVLDADGSVVERHIGPIESEAQLVAMIENANAS